MASSASTQSIRPRQPKYWQVKKHVLGEVNSGRLSAGQSLPSETELAQNMGMARATVRQALGELEKEGIIRRIRGKGTFVTEKEARYAREKLDLFALIVPQVLEHLAYAGMATGFDSGAAEHHYQTMVCSSQNSIDRQGNIILQLIHKKVAGVALFVTPEQAVPWYHGGQLHEHGIALVFFNWRPEGFPAPLITWDWTAVARQAARMFMEKGHRVVAFSTGVRHAIAERFEQTLREELSQHGLSLPEHHVIYDTAYRPGAISEARKRAIVEMLRGKDRPTAVFCTSYVGAELVYYLAEQEGIRVPQDLSIITYGFHQRQGIIRERLTALVMHGEEYGKRAAELLLEIRTGKRQMKDPERILLQHELVEGETLARAPS